MSLSFHETKNSALHFLAITLLSVTLSGVSWSLDNKIVVAAVEKVYLLESGLHFVSRIDTGAKTSSVNAANIRLIDATVEYVLMNAMGEKVAMKSPLIKQSTVKNADSTETRYFVWLSISFNGGTKKILVNLNDRSRSEFKMLLGRNWLSGDYIVDVDKLSGAFN